MRFLRRGRLRARARAASMLALAVGVSAGSLTGCGKPTATVTARQGTAVEHRPLAVVATVYPLAQLAAYIGAGDVHVVNIVPAGQQPQGMGLDAAERALLRQADLVVDVGDGYQPQIEAAAFKAPRHLSVLTAISRQARPYEFWLDPYLMGRAADAVAASLEAADPAARQQFENGDRDFQSVASSIESDFVSTFSQCETAYFVTPDDAFGRMAASFDLVDVPVSTDGTARALDTISTHDLPGVFSEVGVPSGQLDAVARQAHVSVKSLDPLELSPAAGETGTSYFALMEQDLTDMEGPLLCQSSGTFQ